MANRQPSFVTSRDNPLLVRLRKLARHPGEYRKQGQALLEGEHLCESWARRGGVAATQALLTEAAWQDGRFADLARAAAATVIVSEAAMADLSALETPPPIAYVVTVPAPPTIRPDAASVVLDRVQDAGNVGSILRSAAAFGFGQVIAVQGTASLWSAKVLRAGMGAHFSLRLVEGVGEASLDVLSSPLVGTSSHAGQALASVALPAPCAWVFGNEGSGASATLQARCALAVRIPQPGGEESLNVAAAAAVCLYESVRRALA
ncbi:MAG: TrmH family RNA methyltransferase [Caldimonas sp.]